MLVTNDENTVVRFVSQTLRTPPLIRDFVVDCSFRRWGFRRCLTAVVYSLRLTFLRNERHTLICCAYLAVYCQS